jgi:L-fucose isomerase-like protein
MRVLKKSKFALFFGNRGFFPPELISQARRQMTQVLTELGHETLVMDESLTRHGAVSDKSDSVKYANFLKQNEGKYDGVILSLPNFGDESAAVESLRHAGVPVFIQAYPDDINKMAPELRRDAFCGKFSVMDVFYQYGLKFTNLIPHVVEPGTEEFALNIEHFDRVCRVVNGFKDMVVGAVGSRTTAFKTVRIDELALQQNGITMEVIDLVEVFARMDSINTSGHEYKDKSQRLRDYTGWQGVPDESFDKIVRLGVVLDKIFDEWNLDAMGLRCWIELQRQLNISACVLLSEMNDRKIPVACEVDMGNAVAQYALYRASGEATACLDWNNNYGNDQDKCILFHCGSTAQSLMAGKGRVVDHSMLQHDPQVGPNCSFGCNAGRIAEFPFAFSSMTTRNGRLEFYLGEGEFTDDPIPQEFFGCGGVARISKLQNVLLFVGRNGHRHHVSVTPGRRLIEPLKEALEYYLGFNVALPQKDV